MADKPWFGSSPDYPDPVEPSAQAPASERSPGSFSTEPTDATAPMPHQLRPSAASPSQAPPPAAGSSATPSQALPPAAGSSATPSQALPPVAGSSAPPAGNGRSDSAGQVAPPSYPPSVGNPGWSPLGATPSTPPVRTGPEPGAARYLPPVAPPETTSSRPASVAPAAETEEAPRSRGRWGWRALVSFAAGGLIAAAGFGAAQLSPASETAAGSQSTVITSSLPTTTVAPTTATTVRDSGTVPLVPLDVDEPASFVAQTLGPAVVQIDTDLGVGSGVIYGDGLILTNNHVIQGSVEVSVQFADGRILQGEVIGTDIKTDIGVVSVGPGLDLPRAQLATGEKARVGQIAIAIGSPFDLQQSVTAGIVSAVDRPIPNTERGVVAMIQTDAPINPGNSGGALADRQGRVIGINTSIQTDGVSSANVGVGFAIPIDTAVRVADLLVAGEPIEPGFLGVRGDVPPGGEAGVVLVDVTVGSAAEGAGLLVGDRVLSLNGAPVTGFAELAGLVVANQAGDTVTLEVVRDGEVLEIDVVLGLNEN